MIRSMLVTRVILIILAALFSSVAVTGAQPVRERLLEDVNISIGTEFAYIKVPFSFPVRYVRHFPLDVGSEVRIQLEPIAISQQDRDALFKREALTPRVGNPAHAAEILYEGDVPGGPYLSVLFDRPVKYRVEQGTDYRSIVVLVALEGLAIKEMPKAADERTLRLQEEAEQAITVGNYPRAIQLYTSLVENQNIEIRQTAQIMLAEARERNGQMAHAKAEYRRYLELYPDGADVERARQRLADLLAGKVKTGPAGTVLESDWQTDYYGGISQFYDRSETKTDRVGTTLDRSSLDTNIDMTVRLQNDDYDIRAVVIGGHEEDFLDGGDDTTRVNSLYLDFNANRRRIFSRIGRQTQSSGGVLGRFDGGLLSIPLSRRIALNLVGGYPVASSSDGLETDKYFYGANFDLGTFLNHWNFNTYFIQQEANGVTDRQAIGGEIRFFSSRGSFFTLVDYDIHHNELNTVLTNGSYIFPDSTTINLVADYRKSPILTTSNALIGQTVDNLDDLRKFYSDSEIKQLAEDRTATSKNVTLSITRPLTAKVQIAGDVTWAKLDGTEASGEVAAFEGTDDEFYYSLQFIGTSLVREGDLATLGLRYADTTLYDTYSGALDTRYPIAEGWRLNPGMVVDYRDHKELDQDQWQLRPSLRVEYRPRRNFRLEVEGGYEWRTDRFEDSEEDSHGYYISAGYRWDF